MVVLFGWNGDLTGMIAMSTLAAGDGLADIFGRRFGENNKWFFSPKKSFAGSLAFFGGSTITSISLGTWLQYTNFFPFTIGLYNLLPKIILISVICTFVELIPLGEDNWTVPISAAFLSFVLFYR